MRRHHRAVYGACLTVASLTVLPVAAQDLATPPAQEVPASQAEPADTAAPVADTQTALPVAQQTLLSPAPARMSIAEKAAAVTGAVAAGVVAFKGLSALFKSGKKPADAAVPAN